MYPWWPNEELRVAFEPQRDLESENAEMSERKKISI